MKSFVVSFLMLLLPAIAISQNNNQDAVIAASKMNIFYRGLSNPVEIAVPGVVSDKITAKATNGTIKKVNDGWELVPGDQDITVITVMVNNKKVSEKSFRVKNIPMPVPSLAGKLNGAIQKDNLLKSDILDITLPDFNLDIKFTVKSFTLLIPAKKGDIELVSNENKLTDKMKELLSGLERGQSAVFKDIKAVGPDGKIIEIQPLILKVE